MEELLSLPVIITAVVVLLAVILFAIGYVKAPPDMAFIISGIKKKSKIVIGKASIRIPFFERLDKLNLRLIPIDVKTSNAVPTADYININVDATVNVKISNEPDKLRLAAENFLNKNTEYIASVAREVLEGNVREIVGKMKLEEMVSDRQKFATLVKENAEPDLAAMGLDIISFNVQNFVDGNEVIENLGIDNIVKIKKAAAIARAESERDIKVAQASADKESNDAAVAAQTEIAKRQNELAIKKSELQQESDTKKAMADAAYEIQKEEQRKTIEITTANADIARQEREIELKQKEVAVKEHALEAEVKKQAEADRYAAQQRADAALYQRQKEAEAKQFEVQHAAEARQFEIEREAQARKAQAEAERYAKEQEAEGIRKVGEAEAAAIQAKGLAEAEAMEKKAEAYAKYNKAAVAEMMIQVLPEVAAKIAEPLKQIDKITIIGGEGSANGVEQVAGNVPAVMAKLFESMKETTGIDLAEIVKADTYDAKVNRNVNLTGLDDVHVVVEPKETL
ncbi:MAG: flotillin family protein [Lachnospiraceae bacterium]|nr:flotillin family protein [Lachnospiraceae bacterium]